MAVKSQRFQKLQHRQRVNLVEKEGGSSRSHLNGPAEQTGSLHSIREEDIEIDLQIQPEN